MATTLAEELERFLDYLAVERGASVHTIAAYRRDLTPVAPVEPPSEAWVESAVRLMTTAEEGEPPRSVKRRQSAFRSFVKHLRREGRLPGVRIEIESPPLPKRLPKAIGTKQVGQVLSLEGEGDAADLRDRALIELLYGTGIRISEALAVRVREIGPGRATLRVQGKGDKTREVPLPEGVVAVVAEYEAKGRPLLSRGTSQALFLNDKGRPLSRQHAFAIVRDRLQRAGVEGAHGPHTFRHSYAVHLLEGGADLRAVQELLGHENIVSTQIYTGLKLDAVRRHYDLAHPRR